MDYKKTLKTWITQAINKREKNIIDYISQRIEQEYEKPCNSINEIKQRNTKTIGDLFENLCVLYLEYLGYETFLLKDVDDNILTQLKLTRKDYGIDIIICKNGEFSAVQCKYKTRKNKKLVIVSWKELSTFYALCSKTGPWKQKIVMTTANGKKILGEKQKNDITIGYKIFSNLELEDWKKIINYESTAYSLSTGLQEIHNNLREILEHEVKETDYLNNVLDNKDYIINKEVNENSPLILTKEYIREQRLKYLEQRGIIK